MYATLEEIRAFTDLTVTQASDAKLIRAERLARLFIDSTCGQSFNYEPATTYTVRGGGEVDVRLPKRLINLTSINWSGVDYSLGSFIVKGDGWFLSRPSGTLLTIKQAPPEEVLDVLTYNAGPIYVPSSHYGKWSTEVDYVLTGDWGYVTVPEDINMATLLLIETMLCGEFNYQNRNVSAVSTADWSIDFFQSPGSSGNKLVDQLLSKYKIFNLAVI